MSGFTIRVRTQIGTWRLTGISPSDTFQALRERLQKEHNAEFKTHNFSLDPSGKQILSDDLTIREARLKNGDMIHAVVDDAKVGVLAQSTSKKTITKDGHIVSQRVEQELQTQGFRPGMLPLRSMKMQWTLNEFVSLDEQFVYKVKAQEKSNCSLAVLDSSSVQNFQNYLMKFDFRTIRVGYLYGRFKPEQKVEVEAIYEPAQESTDVSFTLLEDSKQHAADAIASLLGLQKVGWIFAHPPREKGFHFSGPEILFAAEQQLEAAGGVGETPFVTVKVTLGETGLTVVDAYQVSLQCMEMVAEGVLQASVNLGHCGVVNTFTALVEGREAKEVDNNFFLVNTPIEQFQSQYLVSTFPRANRIDNMQTREDIKKQLSKAGKEGWSFLDLLADFQLLIYLTEYLTLSDDLPRICRAITDREVPLDEGYTVLIRSIAGLD